MPDGLTPYRRDVVKVLGAGTALTTLGTAAAAQEDDEGGGDEDDGAGDEEGAGEGASGGSGGGSVHEVRTLISEPSTHPDRPADFFFQPTGLHVQPGDVVRFRFVTPDHNVVTYHPAFGMRRRVPTGVDAVSSPLLGWRADSIADDRVDPPAPMEEGGEGQDEEDSADDENGDEGDEAGDETGEEDEGGDSESDGEDAGSDGREPVPDSYLLAFETPGVYDLLCSPHESFGMAMRVVVGDETDAPFETSNPEALPEPRLGPVGLARVTLTDSALEPDAIVEAGSVDWEALQATESE